MIKRLSLAALLCASCTLAYAAGEAATGFESFAAQALYRVEFGGSRALPVTHRLALSSTASARDLGRPMLEYRWSGAETRVNLAGLPIRINGQDPLMASGAGGKGTVLGLTRVQTMFLLGGAMVGVVAIAASADGNSNGGSGVSGNGGLTGNGGVSGN